MSLHETLGDTLKALALKAHEKGIELLSDIEPTLPDKLIGDPVRLRQVIINLVGNAIKFTSKGEVVLSVKMLKRHADSVVFHFAVRDTGIGTVLLPTETEVSHSPVVSRHSCRQAFRDLRGFLTGRRLHHTQVRWNWARPHHLHTLGPAHAGKMTFCSIL